MGRDRDGHEIWDIAWRFGARAITTLHEGVLFILLCRQNTTQLLALYEVLGQKFIISAGRSVSLLHLGAFTHEEGTKAYCTPIMKGNCLLLSIILPLSSQQGSVSFLSHLRHSPLLFTKGCIQLVLFKQNKERGSLCEIG
jgi:hypothetical protein